ncbi:MAG: DUF2867 domain-containing protein [Bacteroidales bacterium]|jgi:hypothetical protein|nr:DUF2867 domain-containing protein [Bacteroidales bacterium]
MKLKIHKGTLPANSLIASYLPANYTDVYVCTIKNAVNITPDYLLTNLWKIRPKWVKLLFKLRHILVKPFGLKTDNGGNADVQKTANETVMQLKDKHLTAEMSVHIKAATDNQLTICVSTVVHFHNKLGVIYFFVIRPFHKIIVRSVFKNAVENIDKVYPI